MNVSIPNREPAEATAITKSPLVSVVIPTLDRPHYLKRLLASIKSQDLADFECIAVDDGSSEDTLSAYGDIWRDLDERFRLIASGDKRSTGLSNTRNRGIEAARGEFVAFCDDDDLWIRQDHLSTATRALRKHGADLFFASLRQSANGTVTRPDFYAGIAAELTRHKIAGETDIFEISRQARAKFLRHSSLSAITVVASRDLLVEAGMYWDKLRLIEDCDFGLRMFDRAAKILYRSTAAAEYEVGPRPSLFRSAAARDIQLFSILSALHAETMMRDRGLRRIARANRAWYFAQLGSMALEDGRKQQAREFARQSLFLHPTGAGLSLLAKSILSRTDTQRRDQHKLAGPRSTEAD